MVGSAIISTERLDELCRQLRERGAKVERDDHAGECHAKHGKQVVFVATQHSRGNFWAANFIQNDLFEWRDGRGQ